MAGFYQGLTPQDVETLDRLSRLLLDLRESRQRLLARHGVDDEDTLLARIRAGEIAEHPAYEDYLGARAISAAREDIRADLRDCMLHIRLP
jgi:hypothetical protein